MKFRNFITSAAKWFSSFSWSTLSFGAAVAGAGVWLKEKAIIFGLIVAALGVGAGLLWLHDSSIRSDATAAANAAWTMKLVNEEKALRERYERENKLNTDALEESLSAVSAKAEAAAALNDTLTAKLKLDEANKPSVVCWPAAVVTRKYGRKK